MPIIPTATIRLRQLDLGAGIGGAAETIGGGVGTGVAGVADAANTIASAPAIVSDQVTGEIGNQVAAAGWEKYKAAIYMGALAVGTLIVFLIWYKFRHRREQSIFCWGPGSVKGGRKGKGPSSQRRADDDDDDDVDEERKRRNDS